MPWAIFPLVPTGVNGARKCLLNQGLLLILTITQNPKFGFIWGLMSMSALPARFFVKKMKLAFKFRSLSPYHGS